MEKKVLDQKSCGADEEPWSSIRDIVDETWFILCPIDTAMDRVLSRQVTLLLQQRGVYKKWAFFKES